MVESMRSIELNKKHIFDENFFQTIDTEEKAYWLGFLYADGGISYYPGDRYRIRINLSKKDKIVLQHFLGSIDSKTHKIKNSKLYRGTFSKRGICYVIIDSKNMINDLRRLKCCERKSFTINFPTNEIVPHEFKRHFLRGFVDGDGWFCNSCGRLTFGFMSTHDFCLEANKWIIRECGFKIEPDKFVFTTNSGLYRVQYGLPYAVQKIKNLLYDNANLYLKRKKDIAFSINTENASKVKFSNRKISNDDKTEIATAQKCNELSTSFIKRLSQQFDVSTRTIYKIRKEYNEKISV